MKEQGLTLKWQSGCALLALLILAGCASTSPAPVVDRSTQPAGVAVAAVNPDLYTVKKGDTMYSIALEHNLDYKDLVTWNGIENPNRILVGQQLRVKRAGDATPSDVVVSQPIALAPMVEKHALDGNTDTVKREPKAGKEPYSEQALAQAQGQAKTSEPPTNALVKPDAKTDAKPEAEAKTAAPALVGDELAWIWPASGKVVATYSESGNKGVDIAGKAGDPVIAAGEGKVVYSGTGLRGYGKLVIVKHNNTYLSAYAHNQNILVKEGQSVSKGQKIAEMGNSDADQVKLHFEVRRQGKPVDPLKYLPQR